MGSHNLTASHAKELVDQIIGDDDGAHALELLELLHGISDPEHTVGLEAKKQAYLSTEHFESSFKSCLESIEEKIVLDDSSLPAA